MTWLSLLVLICMQKIRRSSLYQLFSHLFFRPLAAKRWSRTQGPVTTPPPLQYWFVCSVLAPPHPHHHILLLPSLPPFFSPSHCTSVLKCLPALCNTDKPTAYWWGESGLWAEKPARKTRTPLLHCWWEDSAAGRWTRALHPPQTFKYFHIIKVFLSRIDFLPWKKKEERTKFGKMK